MSSQSLASSFPCASNGVGGKLAALGVTWLQYHVAVYRERRIQRGRNQAIGAKSPCRVGAIILLSTGFTGSCTTYRGIAQETVEWIGAQGRTPGRGSRDYFDARAVASGDAVGIRGPAAGFLRC